MTTQQTQESSEDQGVRHVFQKVINGKNRNQDLDYLKDRTILKTVYENEHQKSDYQKSDLIHNWRINTEKKSHKCEECCKSFNEKSHLIRHQRIHS